MMVDEHRYLRDRARLVFGNSDRKQYCVSFVKVPRMSKDSN